jgi:hypothetical protein
MQEVPGPTVGDFLAQLEAVPWFSSTGRPMPPDLGVERMSAWEDWPGPEEPAIRELSFQHQELYDRIMAEAGDQRAALTELWEAIHAAVFRRASSRVPYDPNQDVWHGPTVAVWQAAWTAGLIGLCLRTGRPVPPKLQEQWSWYARGHWPSGYASLGPDGRLGPLLVY